MIRIGGRWHLIGIIAFAAYARPFSLAPYLVPLRLLPAPCPLHPRVARKKKTARTFVRAA